MKLARNGHGIPIKTTGGPSANQVAMDGGGGYIKNLPQGTKGVKTKPTSTTKGVPHPGSAN